MQHDPPAQLDKQTLEELNQKLTEITNAIKEKKITEEAIAKALCVNLFNQEPRAKNMLVLDNVVYYIKSKLQDGSYSMEKLSECIHNVITPEDPIPVH